MSAGQTEFEARELERAALRPLALRFPTLDAAAAEIARLAAELTLPKGTVHVISDVHGEYQKLRHVINNASGALRPLVERLFSGRLNDERLRKLLTLLFYPAPVLERYEAELHDPEELKAFARTTLGQLFELIRVLGARYSLERATRVFPPEYKALLVEILHDPARERGGEYLAAMVDELARRGRVLHLIHLTVRVVRNLAVDEIVLAGDCWDRGPRGDRVVDYLLRQPRVSFVWGNHDAAWLGACLGHEALLCHVLRISLRYRRLSQLEEGYGVTLQPLEHLVRTVYGDDPAACFASKGEGLRESATMARMQKAAAVMQFKLEGQAMARHPEWEMDSRRLLHRLDTARGTVEVDGKSWPLKDTRFPTLDPGDPYALSAEERRCLDRLRQSFLASQKLWEQMRLLVGRGSMYLQRDGHLIFHGCVPVDDHGRFLDMPVGGKAYAGRALFDAIGDALRAVIERPRTEDLDLLWYLWCGPRSPLFGKDRIATLETYLIENQATHRETKNPYFSLLHEGWFCEKVLQEFGIHAPHGLIVNGHVPVKVEKGEDPLKRSGKAITIDGAFSEAYGDHGFTLVLEAERTYLAKHHHFESVEAAVRDGVDIIPAIQEVWHWNTPRRAADTEQGTRIRCEITLLERLIEAHRRNDFEGA